MLARASVQTEGHRFEFKLRNCTSLIAEVRGQMVLWPGPNSRTHTHQRSHPEEPECLKSPEQPPRRVSRKGIFNTKKKHKNGKSEAFRPPLESSSNRGFTQSALRCSSQWCSTTSGSEVSLRCGCIHLYLPALRLPRKDRRQPRT